MRWGVFLFLLLIVSCGEETPQQEDVVVIPASSIPLFVKQNDVIGYGGAVEVAADKAVLTSNTNPKCLTVSMCRRVEMSKKVTFPVTFSYSFEILKWDVDEYPCGTHKGIPKGCYVIIHQFWNQLAAPRAYAVIQRKENGRYKLSFHNKNDDAVLAYVWKTYLGEGIHNVQVFNDGLGASLTVNGETSGYIEMDVASTYQDYLKWGMYWQKEMAGDIVIRFSDVYLDEGL